MVPSPSPGSSAAANAYVTIRPPTAPSPRTQSSVPAGSGTTAPPSRISLCRGRVRNDVRSHDSATLDFWTCGDPTQAIAPRSHSGGITLHHAAKLVCRLCTCQCSFCRHQAQTPFSDRRLVQLPQPTTGHHPRHFYPRDPPSALRRWHLRRCQATVPQSMGINRKSNAKGILSV